MEKRGSDRPQQPQEQSEEGKHTKTTAQSLQSPQQTFRMWLKEIHQKIRQKKLYLYQLTDDELLDYEVFFKDLKGTIPCYMSCLLSADEEAYRRNYKYYRLGDLLPSSPLTPKESSIKETFEKLQKKQCSLQAMTLRELGRYMSGLLKYEMKLAVPRVHRDEVREEIFMKYRQLKFKRNVRYYPGYAFCSAQNISPLEIDVKYTYLEITAKRYSLREMTLDELETYSKGLQKYQWKLKIPQEHHSEVLGEIAAREPREPRKELQSEPPKKKWAFSSLLSCLSPPKEAKLSEVESKSQNTCDSRPFEDEVCSEQECSLLGPPPKQ